MTYDLVTADCYIYADILRKISIGVYSCGDSLPTIDSLCEQYGFASTTVKKALKRLRTKNLICGETSRGTRVIFDRTNVAHVEALRTYSKQNSVREYNDMEVPRVLLAGVVEAGFRKTGVEVKAQISSQINGILCRLETGDAAIPATQQLLRELVKQTENTFMIDIIDDLLRQFIVFIPSEETDADAHRAYLQLSGTYLQSLRTLISQESGETTAATMIFYEGINKIPGVFVLIPTNPNCAVFRKEKLYHVVTREMLSDITAGKIKKGAFFPSTPLMCRMYGVDRRTICKAYGILEKLHLIKVVSYKGAQLVVDWENSDTQRWIRGMILQQLQKLSQALDVFEALYGNIFPLLAGHATPDMPDEMEERLDSQWKKVSGSNTLMVLADALVTPLTRSVDSAAFHWHYEFLLSIVSDFAAMDVHQIDASHDIQLDIYHEAKAAIVSLRGGSPDGFLLHFTQAVSGNKRIYEQSILKYMPDFNKV